MIHAHRHAQDPSEVKIIYLRATGGEVGASSALAPKIGPLGLVCCLCHPLSDARSNTCSSRPKRSEKISQRRHLHGRVYELPSSSRSRTDKRPSRSCPRPPLLSSALSRVRTVPLSTLLGMCLSFVPEPPRDRKKEKNIKHSGNVTLDEIFDIARTMKSKSLSKDLAGGAKEILGTAQSIGCTVDGRPPHDIIDGINSGEIEVPDE